MSRSPLLAGLPEIALSGPAANNGGSEGRKGPESGAGLRAALLFRESGGAGPVHRKKCLSLSRRGEPSCFPPHIVTMR